jgi:hypothetical protein
MNSGRLEAFRWTLRILAPDNSAARLRRYGAPALECAMLAY